MPKIFQKKNNKALYMCGLKDSSGETGQTTSFEAETLSKMIK